MCTYRQQMLGIRDTIREPKLKELAEINPVLGATNRKKRWEAAVGKVVDLLLQIDEQ